MSGDSPERRLHASPPSVEQGQRLSDLLRSSLPSPRPTVQASQVPVLFREPYILSGYRPVGQAWPCYLLSLFQRHNESLNAWTHLLAIPALLLRCWANGEAWSHDLDAVFFPLCLYVLSCLAYLSCSAAAHLLQSHSELTHYSVFFLDYVGVAVYAYGSALAHYFYGSEPVWQSSRVGPAFLPCVGLLGVTSCGASCFSMVRYRRPYPLARKLYQLIPLSLMYLLVNSPVVHRLVTVPWTNETALPFHALQVAFSLLSVAFFSYPVPERFFPGCCDIVGQGHQIFHVFISLSTLSQLEAVLLDYGRRRDTVLGVFGERQLWFACVLFPVLVLCFVSTLVLMRRRVQKRLELQEVKEKGR
ncbi:membrane progestin receptor beta [Aplochiton taeniatus]